MRKIFRGLASAALVAVAIVGLALSAAAQDIPEKLQPPASEHLLFQLHAKGDQVYVCKNDGAQFAWTLKAPDAKLFDKSGKPFGKHFAGPTWEANDGSRVVGKAVANVPSPDANSVAWLLVTVVSHEGNGQTDEPSPRSSASTRKAAKPPPRAAMRRTRTRNSARPTPPTTASLRRNNQRANARWRAQPAN